MGEVYRARDTRLERTVAVKILPAHFSSDPAHKLRFEREAKTVSALNHPNICSLFDVGSQDGTEFLVMECLEGETLAARLEKGPLTIDQLLKTAAEIADALDKAHRCGVIHRDLKPGNIMLTKNGAKLLDFGLAKPTSPQSTLATLSAATPQQSPVTEQGAIVGTFQYMSPEQVEGRELDGRSDIFSFGAVLYEMVTGKRAFEGRSQLSVASAILEKEPSSVSSLKPLAPRSLDYIVRRCLAKDPDDRWQSARDLALELKSISATDSSSSATTPALPFLRDPRTLLPWTVAALALLSSVALLFVRPRQESSAPVYSSIVSSSGLPFQIEGDLGAPPVLSPDGAAVIFGAADDLWYHSLRTGAERILPGAHGGYFPFWSPDSNSIGFFADGKLKTLKVATNAIRTLCDASSARGGSWSSTGVILFTPSVREVIYSIPSTGGIPTPVTKLDTKFHSTHRWPWFLPDGRHFLYLATNHSSAMAEQNGIFVASLDGKLNRFLISSVSGAIYAQDRFLFVRDTALYAQALDLKNFVLTGSPAPLTDGVVVDMGVWHATFTASETNQMIFQTGSSMARSRMEWVDRQGKHLSFVGDKAIYQSPRLSGDAQRILVNMGDPAGDIWLFDSSGTNKSRLTFEGSSNSEGVWSPDNSRFAFSIGLPMRFKMAIRSLNGSGQETVLQDTPDNDSPTDWSPDGRYVLSERFVNGGSALWLHPLAPGESSRPLLTSPAFAGLQSSGQFSPDGKFVAFTVSAANGPQIFIVPFPGGSGMWQVSTDGGRWPRWRRDGKELYFVTSRNELAVVSVTEKGDGIELGRPLPLFTFKPTLRTYRLGMIEFDVTPDAQRFLLNVAADENVRPLTLLQNWTSLLSGK
jgi:serine/threonine protein kinase/Tol biopolymer transport system component